MTVSELQLEIERGLWDDSTSLAQIERVQLRLYDLIADWKAMRQFITAHEEEGFVDASELWPLLKLKP